MELSVPVYVTVSSTYAKNWQKKILLFKIKMYRHCWVLMWDNLAYQFLLTSNNCTIGWSKARENFFDLWLKMGKGKQYVLSFMF